VLHSRVLLTLIRVTLEFVVLNSLPNRTTLIQKAGLTLMYVCMYPSKVKPFDWPMPHSTPVPASSQSTHECVQKKRMMDANAHGEPSEPHGHAEPDITQQGQPSCGAEQPALKKLALNSPVLNSTRSVDITAGAELEATALTSLEHCARWLSTLTYRTDEPLRRLAEALGVLQAQPSRTRRSSIQSMLKSWGVPQYTNLPRSKIAAPEVEAMLMRKVLEEACRLNRLHHSHGSSSAIRLTLGLASMYTHRHPLISCSRR